MRREFVRIGAALLLSAAACSSDSDQPEGTNAPGVTGTTVPSNTGTAGRGSAGSGALPTTPTTPTTPRAGSAAPTTGASGAAAPTGTTTPTTPATTPNNAAAGSGGSAGSPTSGAQAGTGGGAAAAAGSGAAPSADGALIRGEDPTMDTVMNNGPYAVESYSDGIKDGPAFLAATIYYPKDAEPPFAGIVACPGFTALQDSVAPWGPFLASHGIVLMTIDTNTTGDSVDQRQEALLDALGSLKAEQARSGSPINGKLDMARFGFMGWSMGGGGTWLNANTHPELKSALSLAGHIATQIGGAAQFTKITVPTLLLAGDADDAILGLAMSQPVYEAIPESTPKILYEIAGASHFDIQPMTGGGLFGLYGLSWQKVFLEGDMRFKKFLLLPEPANASDFRSNVK
jgi:dienelactone hydrolase